MACSILRLTPLAVRVIEERSTWGVLPMYEVRLVDAAAGVNVMLALFDNPEEAHAFVVALDLGNITARTTAALYAARLGAERVHDHNRCGTRIDQYVCTKPHKHADTYHRDERHGMEWRRG